MSPHDTTTPDVATQVPEEHAARLTRAARGDADSSAFLAAFAGGAGISSLGAGSGAGLGAGAGADWDGVAALAFACSAACQMLSNARVGTNVYTCVRYQLAASKLWPAWRAWPVEIAHFMGHRKHNRCIEGNHILYHVQVLLAANAQCILNQTRTPNDGNQSR